VSVTYGMEYAADLVQRHFTAPQPNVRTLAPQQGVAELV
jgi:hypothetical protein